VVDAGEENCTHAGYNASALFGVAAGSVSFDEILWHKKTVPIRTVLFFFAISVLRIHLVL
jgi:hypothetical protein